MTQKQIKHVDAYGNEIKPGDTVKVIAVLPEGRYSLPIFDDLWTKEMTEALGEVKEVIFCCSGGAYLGDFTYPSFCLEVINEEQVIEDKLQEELDKNFGGDESKMLREYYKKVYLNQN